MERGATARFSYRLSSLPVLMELSAGDGDAMAISIEISEQRRVRYLHFGSHWIQGAMRIARPHALELEYTREMMLALLLRSGSRWPRHVLLIGLGAASLTKFLYRNRPHAKQV